MNINLKEKIKKILLPFGKIIRLSGKIKQAQVLGLLFVLSVLLIPANSAHAWGPSGWLKDKVGNVGKDILEVIIGGLSIIIYNIGNFFLNLAGQFVFFAAFLVDVMLDQNLYSQVLTSSAIQVGWETMRDFCNMFFIFFLLIIAFATILRISEYSAKNLLPKFLIAIFLINFSMEIAKLVIDFGQVFMYEIASWMGSFSGSTGGGGGLTGIVDYFNNYFNYAFWGGSTPDAAIAILFAATYSFILGLTYIMLAGFLLVRLVMFALLIIIAPFAFFAVVMPSTRHYYSDWWRSIVKYALFGPIFIFFVYISSRMAFELVQVYNSASLAAIGGGYDRVEAMKDFLPKIIPNIVALMMLWAVIPVTQKLGIAGSSRLIGGTAGFGTVAIASWGAARLAGGLGKRAAGGVASRTRLGEKYNRTRDVVEQGIAKVPIIGKGIVLKNIAAREKEKEEKIKKMEVEFGDLKNIDLALLRGKAEKTLGVPGTTDDKALLLKAAAAQGKLGEKDKDGKFIYQRYLQDAQRSLSKKDLEQITNKNLSFAAMTVEGQKRIKAISADPEKSGVSKEALERLRNNKSNAQEEVMREKMVDLIKDGKAHEVQDLHDATTAKIWYDSHADSTQRNSNINRLGQDQRARLSEGLLANVRRISSDGRLVNYKGKEVGGDEGQRFAALSPEQKKDEVVKYKDNKYGIDAVKLGKKIEEAFVKGSEGFEVDVKKALSNFSAKDFTKMDKGDQVEYGRHLNFSQIKSLNRSNDFDAVDRIKKSIDNRLTASTLNTGEAKELRKTRRDIDSMLMGKENRNEEEESGESEE